MPLPAGSQCESARSSSVKRISAFSPGSVSYNWRDWPGQRQFHVPVERDLGLEVSRTGPRECQVAALPRVSGARQLMSVFRLIASAIAW